MLSDRQRGGGGWGGGVETAPPRGTATLSALNTLMEDKRPFHRARWRWDGTEGGGGGGWRGEQSVTSGGGVTPLLSPLRDALAAHNDAERKEEKVVSKRVPDPLEKTFSSC